MNNIEDNSFLKKILLKRNKKKIKDLTNHAELDLEVYTKLSKVVAKLNNLKTFKSVFKHTDFDDRKFILCKEWLEVNEKLPENLLLDNFNTQMFYRFIIWVALNKSHLLNNYKISSKIIWPIIGSEEIPKQVKYQLLEHCSDSVQNYIHLAINDPEFLEAAIKLKKISVMEKKTFPLILSASHKTLLMIFKNESKLNVKMIVKKLINQCQFDKLKNIFEDFKFNCEFCIPDIIECESPEVVKIINSDELLSEVLSSAISDNKYNLVKILYNHSPTKVKDIIIKHDKLKAFKFLNFDIEDQDFKNIIKFKSTNIFSKSYKKFNLDFVLEECAKQNSIIFLKLINKDVAMVNDENVQNKINDLFIKACYGSSYFMVEYFIKFADKKIINEEIIKAVKNNKKLLIKNYLVDYL